MIVSDGSEKNAELGQWITVQKGEKYYFCFLSINMNGEGVTPRVLYKNQAGKYVALPELREIGIFRETTTEE